MSDTPYVDILYYEQEYKGTITPHEAFFTLEKRAETYIDNLTMGRINEVTAAVKNACCAVIDVYYVHSQRDRDGIISENNDGYSVTYDVGRTMADDLYEAAAFYLANTGLMYRVLG